MAVEAEILIRGHLNPPAGPQVLAELVEQAGPCFTREYLDFLQHQNGGEGWLGGRYIILWSAEELIPLNEAYQVTLNAPGLFLFGSNGDGEAYGFDLRWGDSPPVVEIPFVGMFWEYALTRGPSFREFLQALASTRLEEDED